MSSFSVLAALTQFSVMLLLLPYIKYVLSCYIPTLVRLFQKHATFMGLELGQSLASRQFLTVFSHLHSNARLDPSVTLPYVPYTTYNC